MVKYRLQFLTMKTFASVISVLLFASAVVAAPAGPTTVRANSSPLLVWRC